MTCGASTAAAPSVRELRFMLMAQAPCQDESLFADGRLRQDPVEELAQLRQGDPSRLSEVACSSEKSVPLEHSAGQALDVTLTLHRGAATASGLLLRAWLREAQEGVPCAEALLLDWEKAQLQV